eukprot:CAMPEP_0195274014 /NCGR_PEP_ID=MMETSP0706-20130129/16879_1 /TAXON_ID=33640 /ORGANISM="Asterionellopsis glacialis, Strain CCMP134" /LENGTH=72 /DNA_ID=CAMNT_0040330767 /DNA_START=372 /DNA_END=587 /DNA_ORIENTATION=-
MDIHNKSDNDIVTNEVFYQLRDLSCSYNREGLSLGTKSMILLVAIIQIFDSFDAISDSLCSQSLAERCPHQP